MADKEKLSALMDGETIDKALIVDLESDQESMDTWQSYHLIGDVMRGDAPETPEWNIANSVAAALDNEPAHSAMPN
ncbi:sigma-E factor negative regulatory protein, partial [Vibrio splendidus]